jgi:hypothetical protein
MLGIADQLLREEGEEHEVQMRDKYDKQLNAVEYAMAENQISNTISNNERRKRFAKMEGTQMMHITNEQERRRYKESRRNEYKISKSTYAKMKKFETSLEGEYKAQQTTLSPPPLYSTNRQTNIPNLTNRFIRIGNRLYTHI